MECLLAMCNMKAAAASSFVIQPRGCSDERETTRTALEWNGMAPCANLIATFGHYCLALMHFWTIHRTDTADTPRFWGDFINFACGMLLELRFLLCDFDYILWCSMIKTGIPDRYDIWSLFASTHHAGAIH